MSMNIPSRSNPTNYVTDISGTNQIQKNIGTAVGGSTDSSPKTSSHTSTNEPTTNQVAVEGAVNQDRSKDAQSLGEKQLAKMIEDAVRASRESPVKAEVAFQDHSNKTVIKLWNKETGELIREIPPEKTKALMDRFDEIRGILFDEKA